MRQMIECFATRISSCNLEKIPIHRSFNYNYVFFVTEDTSSVYIQPVGESLYLGIEQATMYCSDKAYVMTKFRSFTGSPIIFSIPQDVMGGIIFHVIIVMQLQPC